MAKLERFQIKGAPTCRVAYTRGLFEKQTVKGAEGAKPKYQCVVLVPKNDAEKVAQVTDAFNEAFAALQGMGSTLKSSKGLNPKNNAIMDGDEYADVQDGRDAFKGYLMIRCSSPAIRPIITDRQKRAILNGVTFEGRIIPVDQQSDEELGSGDYVIPVISFWPYKQSSFEGIGCNPVAFVRIAEGERIGGGSTNIDDYVDLNGYE